MMCDALGNGFVASKSSLVMEIKHLKSPGFHFYYLPPARDINLHHVCTCVRRCVRECVFHAVFSTTITVRHFLSKKSFFY